MQIFAEINAQRYLLAQLWAQRLLVEPDPLASAIVTKEELRKRATKPPRTGTGLDPATSDVLAAMTDEHIAEIMDQAMALLRKHLSPEARSQ